MPGVLAAPRERRVLGQEAVAGVDRARHRCPWPPAGPGPRRGTTPWRAPGRAVRPRRRAGHGVRSGPGRSTPRPCAGPSSRAVRMIRTAISPRLATSSVSKWRPSVAAHSGAPIVISTARRVEAVAGVVDLGAVGDQHQHVALGAQGQRETRRRDAVDDAEGAVLLDRHVHVPVDVGDQVALAEAVTGALGEEVVHAGVLGPGVVAVAQGVGLLGAGAADRVVPAARRPRRPSSAGCARSTCSTLPVVRKMFPCAWIVSGAL